MTVTVLATMSIMILIMMVANDYPSPVRRSTVHHTACWHWQNPPCTVLVKWLSASLQTKKMSMYVRMSGLWLWQLPYIIHGANAVAESDFIIRYLANTYPEKVPKLGPEHEAISVLTNALDIHLSMAISSFRWLRDDVCPHLPPTQPPFPTRRSSKRQMVVANSVCCAVTTTVQASVISSLHNCFLQ
jgi:hypothetical protein